MMHPGISPFTNPMVRYDTEVKYVALDDLGEYTHPGVENEPDGTLEQASFTGVCSLLVSTAAAARDTPHGPLVVEYHHGAGVGFTAGVTKILEAPMWCAVGRELDFINTVPMKRGEKIKLKWSHDGHFEPRLVALRVIYAIRLGPIA